MTISAWVNVSALDSSYRRILTRNGFPSQQWYLENDGSRPGHLQFSGTCNPHSTDSTNVLKANTWYHIVLTDDGSTENLYIDGKLDTSTTACSPLGTTGDIAIGSEPAGAASSWVNIQPFRRDDFWWVECWHRPVGGGQLR
jgi:Concanavalin A-like lectin/glucanases superfamily